MRRSVLPARTSVYLQRFSLCSEYRMAEIIDGLGLMNAVENARSIVIKPNLCAGAAFLPHSGVVTNPDVLDLLIRALLRINPNLPISIAESDSIGLCLASQKFEYQRYEELFAHYPQVRLVDLSRSSVALYPSPGLFFRRGIVLPRILLESDLFISVAKLKTHANTVISGVLKNQFGCLAEGDKARYHPYLPEVLADINAVARPHLAIVEGCPAMEGRGPIDGTLVDMDLLLLGVDPVAVDATMARVMWINPKKVTTLSKCQQAGVGTINQEAIETRGPAVEDVRRRFAFISAECRFYVWLGFSMQRLADRIHHVGHTVHGVQGTRWALRKLAQKVSKRVAER